MKEDAPLPPSGPIHDQDVMLERENEAIWGSKIPPEQPLGIALSGGGIRAAIVALGVLQTLAKTGLLERFHYLSTVSGGGYIGTALTWFWSPVRLAREREKDTDLPEFGPRAEAFPFQDRLEKGSAAYERAVKNLDFLRNHGSYLTTGDGIGMAGLAVAVVRTVLVSLLVWFPLMVAGFLIIARIDEWYCETPDACSALWIEGRPVFSFFLGIAALLGCVFFTSVVFLALVRPSETSSESKGRARALLESGLWIVAAMALSYLAFNRMTVLANYQGLSGAFITTLFFGSAMCVFLAMQPLFGKNPSYLTRRLFERLSSSFLPLSVTCLVVGVIPWVVGKAAGSSSAVTQTFAEIGVPSSLLGTVSLLSGVGTALYGYYLKAKSVAPSLAGQLLGLASSILFIFGLFLFSFIAADIISSPLQTYQTVICICVLLMSLALGTFSSINTTGLHRFYRDRLMETFMPMTRGIDKGLARASNLADVLTVDGMWDRKRDAGRHPFHIINAHVILSSDDSAKINVRGGDNFTISGAYIGSQATGWLSTREFLARHGPLTLASAMAASGAAATAHAGYIGTGLTRKRFISAVMSILNIRLGLWVGNPGVTARHGFLTQRNATYFRPGLLSGIFGYGYRSGSRFLELSDGGHFENLGLYELIRRKVAVAVVVDAEQDESISLSSLVSAVSRIKEDFDVDIHFEENRGPELLIGQESKQYPSGVRIAKSPFIVGEIQYPGRHPGALIYIKSTMMTGLDFVTDGYRAANPAFPHQSTIDQFFEPAQFEAYRDLGGKSAAEAVRELDLARTIESPRKIIERFNEIWKAKEEEQRGSHTNSADLRIVPIHGNPT
ncbi:patatin-like phospholipase family protein [Rhizobium redzepovicii]|uniref:patatin-like phospholipase family protein n=1 Tax=Rhizobium redzepovicii TaxID=2867518 RepID=UPI0028729E86|nr:patatin-like phospholipase family protein [Rhizobium redzepovicii]MDR9782110.1 patatin-like phospholipase family protein [Rhizobium redzepovicii]